MTRAFRPDPIPRDALLDLIDLASRAPSAGKTQGWHLVVLEGALTAAFWDVTLPVEERGAFPWPRLLDAPVIALPLADPQAYLDRYSAPDKAHAGLGSRTESWPVPYWTVDTAMSVQTMLLAAEDEGLGALFFGVFTGERQLREDLGIPEHLQLLGAVALGYPVDPTGAADRTKPTASRPTRRRPEQILHIGGW
jgi:nitroreductase